MLISTVRFYERVLAGVRSDDPDTQDTAESCLSWLAFHLRKSQVVLPPAVEECYHQLPEVK